MQGINPLKYGQQLYLFTPYDFYLFGRGFINRKVYLSDKKTPECIFVFEQKSKHNTKSNENHDTIIYGTQLVIKHKFSDYFLCIEMVESNLFFYTKDEPELYLSSEENQCCYFQLQPQRNFQQNGQIVTLNSFFAIQSSHYNFKQCCISSFLRTDTINPRYSFRKSDVITRNQQRNLTQISIRKATISSKHEKPKIVEARSLKNIKGHKLEELNQRESQDEISIDQEGLSYSSDQEDNMDQNSENEKQDSESVQSKDHIKKKMSSEMVMKKTVEIEDQEQMTQQTGAFKKVKKIQNFEQNCLKTPRQSVSEGQSIFPYLKYFNLDTDKFLPACKVQSSDYSFWKVQLKPQSKGEYLDDNDYVQFIYSNKSDGILNISIDSYPFQVKYETTKGEEEELFSSFFKVEIENDRMYLKHILTDLYFPLNAKNQKIEFQLIPVCNQDVNQLPVYEIKFAGKVFEPLRSDFITLLPFEEYKTDAFYVNKVEKHPINEILSCQGISEQIWINYLKEFLNKKGKKGQKILKEVQFLKYIVQIILPKLKKSKSKQETNLRQQAYKLLFKACLFNNPIKRYLIENHIEEILKERKKEFINDLIIELLESGEGLLQKYITPEVIGNVIKQMIEYTENQKRKYSISYMRLFRIFCGTDSQSCTRNQNIMFNYFFTGKKFSASQKQSIPISTESYILLERNKGIQIEDELKFQIIEGENNEIFFKSDDIEKSIDYFLLKENEKEKDYLRQYLYLLADTMKNENNQTIGKFTNQYEFKLLMKILTHPRQEYAFLKGPVLSLILTAYFAEVMKFKFYIFYSMYPKICYKGKLLAQNISQNFTKLLQYIKYQIQTIYYKDKLDKTHFNSTTFKHFLSLIKISIECALWNDENELLDTIQWLEKVFEFEENLQITHQNYEEKLQATNLMNCKILAVEIYTLYVDLQINMCISELLQKSQNVLTSQIINDKISDFYRKSCSWNLNKLIFKICSTSNSELMKKSLFLFKKIYNIKSIVEEQFNEARKQLKQETESMKDKIGFIKSQSNVQLSINTQEDCQNFINAIYNRTPRVKEMSLPAIKAAIQSGENIMLENIYGYDKPNHQFQELCYKLGIHNKIIQTLTSYLNLRKKEQDVLKKQTLSNQLFLLLALIISNLQLKEAISEYRHLFIALLSDDSELYYISCEILREIYDENRKLVVSDTKNLEKICSEITQCLKKGTYHLKNKIDIHHSTKEKMKDQMRRNSIKRGSSVGQTLLANTEQIEEEEKQVSLPILTFNKVESAEGKIQVSEENSHNSYPPKIYQAPLIKDSECYRFVSKKQSIYHNTVSKSLTVKDCKLFFFLLTFLRIQNKRIQKNEKIILKSVFNKDNLMLIEEKIKAYDNDDNLIEIFKVLIYHLLESLGKNPDILFTFKHSHSKLQRRKTTSITFEVDGQLQNEKNQSANLSISFHRINGSVITQKILNNLIMCIRFKNWELKKIVYKILENKVKHFKIIELRDLLRFIQIDLTLFCQMLRTGQTYDSQQNDSFSNEQISMKAMEIEDKRKSKVLKNQVQAFVKCCPFIVKTLESIMVKLRNYEKQIKSEILSLLLIDVEKLFLLRSLFSLQVIQGIQNLPINLEPLLQKNLQIDSIFKSIDLGNLFKISIFDWTLKELQSEIFKSAPLISQLENKWEIINRDKIFKGKNTLVEEILPEPFLLLLKKKISMNPLFVRFPDRTVIFQTQKQVLKKFILNLIKVNSSDSNVLSDELKTFFLTYLSHSYLESDRDQNQKSSFSKGPLKNKHSIKLVDKEKLPQILHEGEQFERKQDLLIEYEIPLVVCTILEEGFRNRYDLFCHMFELVNRLLEGGNTKGQAKFLTAFKNDHKNTIFQNISTMMMDILETIKFYYTNQNLIPLGYHSNQSSYQFFQSKYERKIVCKLLCDVFRFLQLLCENNNRKMKNYIFSQYDEHDKIKYLSVNFVHIAIEMIYEIVDIVENNVTVLNTTYQKELLKEVKEYLLPIPNSILDFLIEVCQIPALQNQIYLCKTDFFKVISKIQKLSEYHAKFITRSGPLILANPQQAQESLSKLFFVQNKDSQRKTSNELSENILFIYQRKLIILFRSLLEQQNPEIISIMSKKLSNKEFEYFINESLLHGGLEDIEKLKVLLLQAKLNHHLETIVDVLIVKKILNIISEFSFTGIKKEIINSLQSRIQSIDINFQNQNLRVYFPSHPLFDLLTQRTKKFFLDKSIVLKSRNQKLRDFIISRHVIYQDIENEKSAQNKIMNDKNMHRLCNLSIGISYIIIALLILFYSVSKAGTVLDVIETQIISSISLMQLIVTIVYTVLWGINITPITKEKLKTKQFHMSRKYREERKLKERKKELEGRSYLKEVNIFGKYLMRFKEDLNFMKEIYIQESASFHVVLLLLVSLFAFFVEVRVYSFTLIFLFSKIELLESILKAIRLTWKQLLIVCLLAFVFSFIFGFMTINNYIVPLYENEQIDIDINRINEHCNSIASCIKSLYTQRIIGQSVNQDGDENQFFSDLVYWGFFEILLTNIIAAIIIDKFAEQRNAKEKIENQRHNRCYICSADKPTLERKGVQFSEHINKTHYLWNYFYYMYSLERLKDSTEFTGIQYWIEHQIKNCKIQWVPLDESKRDDFTQEKIDFIYDWIQQNSKIPTENQTFITQNSKSKRKNIHTKTFESVIHSMTMNKKSDFEDSEMQFQPHEKIKRRKGDFIDESAGQQSGDD